MSEGEKFVVGRVADARAAVLTPGLRRTMLAAASGMRDVIGLGRGDPDIDTPHHIIEAAKRALDEGFTHYTPWNGFPKLRAAIADKLARENGVQVDPESEVLVTGGAQEAVFIAAQVLLRDGDEVLMPDPHYSSYDVSIQLAGGIVVPVPTYERDNFDVQLEALAEHVTPRTKVLVLVNPNNPAGNVLGRDELMRIAAFVARHELTVISDEIYEKYIYDGTPHVSFASLPNMRDRTITINSFSKTYAMTGWRIGYLAGPAAFVRQAGELKYALSICAPAATQMAAIAALEGSQDHIAEVVRSYDERRRFLLAALDKLGLTYAAPQGGFTVLANIRSTGLDSVTFCLQMLKDAHVQIFPGVMYGPNGEGYARISFLAPIPTLADAVRRIGDVLSKTSIAKAESPRR